MGALTMIPLRARLLLVAAVLVLGALPTPAEAQTVVVNTTNDAGAGSLRAAIEAVNAGTANAINMTGLAGGITLLTPLPTIVNPVTIIGAGPGLTIDGDGAAEVLLDTGAEVTIANFVVGDAFTKDGAGTLRWGGTQQTFTGETFVAAGVLRTITSDVLSAASSVVVAPGAVLDLNGTNQTVGDLTVALGSEADLGAGTLTINGSAMTGTLVSGILSGDGGSVHVTDDALFFVGTFDEGQGTYTGTTRASGNAYVGLFGDQILSAQSGLLLEDNAFVEIDGANTFASLSGTGGELFLCDCTSVTFAQDVDTTFAGALSGDAASTFTKAGTGRLMLSGDTSLFFGALSVTGGVLAGTTDSLTGDIDNDGTVEFDQDTDGAYAGVISGTGAVLKSGTGAVEFTSTSTYTGGTTVDDGTLVVGAVNALGLGALTMNGGLLQVDFDQTVTALSGTGDVELADAVQFTLDGSGNSTFGGSLTGGLGTIFSKEGTGTFTVDGGLLGTETVQVLGGTLDLATTGALSNVQLLAVDSDASVTLGADQTVGDIEVADDGLIDLGANTLTIDGSGGLGSIVSGTIAGAGGSLHVTGDAGVVFGLIPGFGAGTYTGTTRVSGNGVLGLFGDQVLSAETGIVLEDNGSLQIDGVMTFASLSGTGGELDLCDCTELTINQSIDTTFAGALVGDAAATFTKAGTGRLTLSGDGSMFFGTIAVTGGVLEGTTGSLTGDIVNDALVEFNQDTDGAYAGVMSGSGALIKSGTGIVAFTSSGTFTGGTTVEAGTLVVGADDALGFGALTMNGGTLQVDFAQAVASLSGTGGVVDVDGQLEVDQDTDTTFGGTLTGTGDLAKLGGGMLTLTGANTFSGEVYVGEGTLALGGAGALTTASFIEIDDEAELRLLSDQTIGDFDLSADGTLAVGSHTLTVNSGAFGSFLNGNVTGNGAIVVDGTTGIAVTNSLGFSGSITFQGGSSSLLFADNAIANASGVTINGTAYLEVEGVQRFGSLSGNGGELFLCDCAEVTIDQDIDTTFAGALSSDADATFTKAGTGRLYLTGDSSLFLGAMSVTGGTLAGTTDSLQGAIANDAILEFAQDTDGVFGGEISGTGAVRKTGTGVVELTTANTYTGGTVVVAGTLVADDNEALGTGALTVTGGTLAVGGSTDVDVAVTALSGAGGTIDIGDFSTLLVDQAGDTTYAGGLEGSGGFGKAGAGTLSLTSATAFTGVVSVTGGVLALDAANTIASADTVLVSSGSLRFGADQSLNQVFVVPDGTIDLGAHTLTLDTGAMGIAAGAIVGDGALVVGGSMELGLLAQSTYAGGTTVRDNAVLYLDTDDALLVGSALTIDDDAAAVLAGHQTLGSLSGNGGEVELCTCSILTINQAIDTTFAGSLIGDGAIVKSGAGALTLAGGSLSNATSTVVEGGTLRAVAANAIGSGALTLTGGTLALDVTHTVASLSGTGGSIALADGQQLTADQDVDTVFGGAIALGADGVFTKEGLGELTLTGAFAGGSLIVSEGSLVLGAPAVLAGGVDLAVWSLATLGGDQAVRNLNLDTTGVIDLGAGTLTVAPTASGSFAFGTISGAGSLHVTGSNELLLGGANTHTGSTIVSGSASIAVIGTFSGASALELHDSAEARLGGSFTFDGLSGTGGAVVIGHGETLTIDQAANTSFAGSISEADFGGADSGAALVKTGAGTLTLTGTSSYTGGTTVTGGTLAGTTSSLRGNIVNAAIVSFDQSSSGTFDGVITGGGSVLKRGGGTLFVTGGFDHTGGTFVLGGTLSGNAGSLRGTIVNDARVEFVQDGAGEFDGVISGTGSVTARGGTLVFNGANSYSGGTTIAGGTLVAASDASLGHASGALAFESGTLALAGDFFSSRAIALAGSGTIDTNDFDALLAGSIAGSGALTKRGSGVLFLTGDASHTGGTNVLEGVLGGDTSNLQGSILNDAFVVFDQTPDGIFAGAMRGTGALVKQGEGTLTIAGAQTFTGLTFVTEGGLDLGGSLAGSVVVGEGATFGGAGAVGGSVFVEGRLVGGAIVSSGAGGGGAGAGAVPMRISGDLVLTSASVYEAQVGADASVATMAVDGRAAIDGATLHLATSSSLSSGARRSTSTVLTASEIAGGFGAVTGLESVFDPFIFASSDSLMLLLVRNDLDFAEFASSANAGGVGAALSAAQPGATGDLAFVLRELSALDTDEDVAAALDRMSGAAHASFAGISMIGSADMIDVLTTRLTGRGGWWAEGLGSSLSLDGELDPGASSVSTRGIAAGYDRRWSRVTAGVAGGYHDSGIDASAGLDRIDGRAYRGALYGEYRAGRVMLDAIVSAASHRVRGSRAIGFAATYDTGAGPALLFGGVDRTSQFEYDATEVAAVIDAGYAMDVAGFAIRPSVGAQFTRISRDGFAETGAESLGLTASAADASSTAARARLWIERRIDGAARRWFAPRASVRYTRELGDRDVPFTASIAGASFTARGFALPASLISASGGVAAGFGPVSFSLDYRGGFAAGQRQHLVSAGIGF